MQALSVHLLEAVPLKQRLGPGRRLRSDLDAIQVRLERRKVRVDVVEGGRAGAGEDASEPGAGVEAAGEIG